MTPRSKLSGYLLPALLLAPVFAATALSAPAAPKKKTAPAAAPTAPKLTVDQVMSRHITALGGEAAIRKLTSLEITADLEVRPAGITGTSVIRAKAPNKISVSQTLKGIGETRQAYDGATAWMSSALTGTRVLTGGELDVFKRGADFYSEVNWKTQFTKTEMIGVRSVSGRTAYALRFTPATGKPETRFYDSKSFELLRTDVIVEGPQGTIPTESYFSDYRPVEGVMQPFTTRQRIGGGQAEVIVKTKTAKANLEIADSEFKKPEGAAPKK